jgi:hypothetical protein
MQPVDYGCILPPTKMGRQTGVPGERRRRDVLLEGRIGTDGFINGLRLIAAADEEFARASFAAVNQWQFTPTRLGGVPIETVIKVTINFKAE